MKKLRQKKRSSAFGAGEKYTPEGRKRYPPPWGEGVLADPLTLPPPPPRGRGTRF